MKVLMFSTDKSVLEKDSLAQKRLVEYGTLAEKLFIVVLSKKKNNNQPVAISQNTTVCSAWFWSAWNSGKKFKNQNIDLITSQDPFETGLIGYLAACRLKAKLQLQIHTDFLSPYFIKGSFKNRIRVWLAKFLLPKADSIRVVSQRIKRSLLIIQQFNNITISVLPIFVDVQKIQSAPVTVDLHKKYPQFDFIILMASRLTREKNISLAITAMSKVVKTNSKVGLIIIGDGPEKDGLQLATINSQLSTSIIFELWTDSLASYYKTADAFLNSSNYEGYGRTLIEAASAGCPIITTNVGVVGLARRSLGEGGEAINKDNSLVVPVGDAAALAASMMKLIENKSLRQALSLKVKDAVANLGNKEAYLEKYKQSWQV